MLVYRRVKLKVLRCPAEKRACDPAFVTESMAIARTPRASAIFSFKQPSSFKTPAWEASQQAGWTCSICESTTLLPYTGWWQKHEAQTTSCREAVAEGSATTAPRPPSAMNKVESPSSGPRYTHALH